MKYEGYYAAHRLQGTMNLITLDMTVAHLSVDLRLRSATAPGESRRSRSSPPGVASVLKLASHDSQVKLPSGSLW